MSSGRYTSRESPSLYLQWPPMSTARRLMVLPRGVIGSLQIATVAFATRSNSFGGRHTSLRSFAKAASRYAPSPPPVEGSGLPPPSTSPADAVAWTSTISSSRRCAASATASSGEPLPGTDSALNTIPWFRVPGSRASTGRAARLPASPTAALATPVRTGSARRRPRPSGVIRRFVRRITLIWKCPPAGIYARIFAGKRLRGRTLVHSAAPEFQS